MILLAHQEGAERESLANLALVQLARLRLHTGAIVEAESLYRRCIRDFPMLRDPYVELGRLLERIGRAGDAEQGSGAPT